MIKVKRPNSIPKIITNRGASETNKNNSDYLLSPLDYDSGSSTFDIKSSIYNAKSVKVALKKAQSKKCCFCEKLQLDEYGAVEHYRPKGGYKLSRSSALCKPGYYWVGYTWDNLFFVCESCNKKKSTIFPIQDETYRAKDHRNNILTEKPLLLNPAGRKDPRNHIKFNNQFIIGKTKEGKQTIEICKLDRAELNEERLKVLEEIEERVFLIIANRDQLAVSRAKSYIKKSILPTAPFSAMAQDYLINNNIIP